MGVLAGCIGSSTKRMRAPWMVRLVVWDMNRMMWGRKEVRGMMEGCGWKDAVIEGRAEV